MAGSTSSEERVPLQPLFDDLKRHLKKTTVDSLAANATPKQVHVIADTTMDAFGSTVDGIEKIAPPEKPVACRKGCAHCCHVTVMTDAATVLRIADHVRKTFTAAERTLLDMRMIVYEDKVEAMTRSQRSATRLPCPLLADGACTAYEVRPLPCRAFNSYDADVCDRQIHGGGSVNDIPSWSVPWQLGASLQAGLKEALADSGHPDGDLELGLALKAALDSPNSDKRWLAGDKVFARSAWKARKP